jgi:hypothetical protein
MEFGMFHEFQALPGETAAQSFAHSLAQVEAAEEWGLDAMWPSCTSRPSARCWPRR